LAAWVWERVAQVPLTISPASLPQALRLWRHHRPLPANLRSGLDLSEETFAEELAGAFDAMPVPEGVLGRGNSLCAARFWVFHIGDDRLEALGLTPGSMTAEQAAIAVSQIPPDEAQSVQGAFQAVCFRDLMVDSFVQQLGLTNDESECLYEAMIDDEVTKWVFTDPSIGENPEFQTSFQAKLAACT
jgi:hypothetical protein